MGGSPGRERYPFKLTRLKNQLLSFFTNPFNMIVLVSLILLVVLIIIPLLRMFQTTFFAALGEVKSRRIFTLVDGQRVYAQLGDFTLYYWQRLFASHMSASLLWGPLSHSLFVGIITTLIAVPLGSILAWVMVRSDIPGKRFIGMAIIVPYMIPSWCKSMSWLAVFRNARGGGPGFLAGLGVQVPDWLAYGPVAMVLVMTLHYYAFSYIMVSSSLRSVNSELEEMAEIQGAGKLQIFKEITFPLVTPAVLSATIMTISKAIGTFGVAAILGDRIGYMTLATKMKDCINGDERTLGYVMALLLIFLASGTIFANQIVVGTRKSYETLGGKGTRHTPISLGGAKAAVCVFIGIFLVLAMVMPMFVLLMETFQIHTGGGYGPGNLTLYNWIGTLDPNNRTQFHPGIFRAPEFLGALRNTIVLTLISSLLTALSGQFLGYISSRGRGKFYGKITEQLVFLPYLMPAIVFSAIYFAMWSQDYSIMIGGQTIKIFPSLYGTFAILVLTSVVKHFPFASRAGTANMMQISSELEEAADVAGASFWRRMTSIVIPLAKQGFLSGFMLVFISIAKELDLIIMLQTPANRTLSYLAFTYNKDALPQMADAVSVVVLMFVVVCYGIAYKFGGADVSKSWG
jgi:iron(III) transport system permease protein